MRSAKNKKETAFRDDSLFGLLLSYKSYNTYLRLLMNDEKSEMAVIITGNPASWKNIPADKLEGFRPLKRLEIGTHKLFTKYILPEHLIRVYGPCAGINITSDKMQIENKLKEGGYYMIITSAKQGPKIYSWVKKIVNLSPQRKYEIHEICIAEGQV